MKLASFPVYGNGDCPRCGGSLIGDGYTTVLHCESTDLETVWNAEPDARPIYCDLTGKTPIIYV